MTIKYDEIVIIKTKKEGANAPPNSR